MADAIAAIVDILKTNWNKPPAPSIEDIADLDKGDAKRVRMLDKDVIRVFETAHNEAQPELLYDFVNQHVNLTIDIRSVQSRARLSDLRDETRRILHAFRKGDGVNFDRVIFKTRTDLSDRSKKFFRYTLQCEIITFTLDATSSAPIVNPATGSVSIASSYQEYDTDLTALATLSHSDGSFIVSDGSTWTTENGATARTSLGLGSLAVQDTIVMSDIHSSLILTSSDSFQDSDSFIMSAAAIEDRYGGAVGDITSVVAGTGLSGGGTSGDVTLTLDLKDEDNMASNSATHAASQQSIKAYVDTEVSNLIDSAPGALDTLNELAAAINDDASFSSTITTSIGTKLAKSSNLSDLANAATARSNLGVDAAGTDNSTNVTLVTSSHDYLSISGQAITLGQIDISDDTNLAVGSGLSLSGDTLSANLSASDIPNLATSKITSGTFADARIAASNVTQHQAALSITESQISDLGTYLTAPRTVTAGGNTLANGETLAFTAGSNIAITESAGAVTIAATDTNTQLSQEQVEDYVDGLLTAGSNISLTYNDSGGTLTIASTDTNTQLSTEEVQDIAGPLVATGGTKTFIAVTYDDANNNMDFVVPVLDEDNMASNSATNLATQQSIKTYVDTEIADLVDSAPAALDTLNELAVALQSNDSDITTITTALGNRLRVDTASQGLTSTQQSNALTNLGITATLAEINILDDGLSASDIPSLATSKITSGTFADARIAQSNVTQHQAALSITESQISDLGSYITAVRTVTAGGNTLANSETLAFTAGSNVTITESGGAVTIASADTNTQLSTEEVQDIVGAMVSGNTETNITVTYDDTGGKLDFSASGTTYSAASGGGLSLAGTAFSIDDPINLDQLTESTDATDDKILLWDESASSWKYMTLDDLQDSIDTTAGATEAFKTISISGQSDVVADAATDTLTFAAGSNVTLTTNASTDTITIASTDTNTQLTQEQVEDYINGLIVAGSNITKTYDDAAGTLTIASTDTNTQLTQEQVEDFVNGVIVAGSNISKTYDDAAGTLTIASTDTNTQLSTEQVQDIAGPLVATGGTKTFISVTYDDTNGDMDFVVPVLDEDDMTSNSATNLATQQSIKAYVDAEVSGLVDSAPAALNTLNELAAALGDDASFSTTTSTALGNRLRVDTASQGLTSTQQSNALTNLGITATLAEINILDDGLSASDIPSLATSKITSGTFADARIAQSNVTQHQAALSITESQISDLGSYITAVRTVTAGGNTLATSETLAFTAGSNITITESAGAVTIATTISELDDLSNAIADADSNIGIGSNALDSLISGAEKNVAIGVNAGTAVTDGDGNIIVGYDAGKALTTGTNNVAIGLQSLDGSTTSSNIIAIGPKAVRGANPTNSIGIGSYALNAATSGSNIAIGLQSLRQVSTGEDNLAVGIYSGDTLTTGSRNAFLGHYAGYLSEADASDNVAIGHSAGYYASQKNTFVGTNAGKGSATSTGDNNIGLGYDALNDYTTGANNIAIGYQAGDNITTGSNNIVIGAADVTATGSDQLSISSGDGNVTWITGDSSGHVSLGNYDFNADQTVSLGQDNYVLTYDHSAGTIGLEAAVGTTYSAGNGIALSGTTFSIDDPANLTQLTELTDATDDKILLWDESASSWKYMTLDDLQDSIDTTASGGAGEAFKTISVSGQSDVVADGSADTLTLAEGSNVTITTNASSDTITIAATDTNTQLSQEQVEDYVNGVIVAGSNISKTYDDAAGTLTIAATDTNTQLSQEQVEDYVNGVIVAGSNISKTYDDAAGTLTIAATDTNTQLSQEQVEDYVNGLIVAGSNISKTYDDAAGTLTIAATDTNTTYSAGTGLDLGGTTFSVDVSDFMTNGSNNRLVTATGTDGMNAEANLTFDGSTLTVTGHLAATTKSFVIPHPTKKDMTLHHGSLEGPEHGVYHRGRLTDKHEIVLPDYWDGLVDENTITVQLTPYGDYQMLFVESIENNIIRVENEADEGIDCFFIIHGERKDIGKLEVEY
jgi:hypothetical protein